MSVDRFYLPSSCATPWNAR